jgi:hypothetical protein
MNEEKPTVGTLKKVGNAKVAIVETTAGEIKEH